MGRRRRGSRCGNCATNLVAQIHRQTNSQARAAPGETGLHFHSPIVPVFDDRAVLVKMGVINAIKSTVPEEMWGEIVRRLDDDETQSGESGRNTLAFEDDCYDGFDELGE